MEAITQPITYFLLFIALYFEVFLLITYFEHSKSRKIARVTPQVLPSVSILVPCWNEEKTVTKTINSILKLDYPKDKLFVFIIDDGSTDKTWEVIQEFASNKQVTLLKKGNGGKASSLNYALQYVRSDMVGCLDADSFVDSEALR